MKKPQTPPGVPGMWEELRQDPQLAERLSAIFSTISPGPLVNGKYLHWDKLRHLPPPQGNRIKNAVNFRSPRPGSNPKPATRTEDSCQSGGKGPKFRCDCPA